MRLRGVLKPGILIALALDVCVPGGPAALIPSRAPTSASSVDWARAFSTPQGQAALAAAVSAQDAHADALFALPGVVGTAIGLGPEGPVVKVYLSGAGVVGIPAALDGVPTDTEVTGRFVSLGPEGPSALPTPAATAKGADRKAHFPRPVPIGVSSGQLDVTAGTLGARVTNGADVFALSNNHVFANSNRANLGDAVLQPGRVDGGTAPGDVLGTLHDFEPITFCRPAPLGCPNNHMDAAVAAVTSADVGQATPDDGYGLPRGTPLDATLLARVQKYGRTTGHTKGAISGLFATVNVDYRIGTARFVNQIIITGSAGEFSGPGDSGSLVVSDGSGQRDRRPVGLLFAGSRLNTIISPIAPVLERFEVRIDGEGDAP